MNQANSMRKKLLLFFIISFCFTQSFAQEGLYQFTKSYFRSDPFEGEFSAFLKHLLKDPVITNRQTLHRTDSSLFSFFGVYNNYNPFFFKPERIEILLEEAPIQYADSIPVDTIFVYQLFAYADGNNTGKLEVKKEFEKIQRKFNKKFDYDNNEELKTGLEITGGIHNYFVAYSALAPVSVAWSMLKDTVETVLNLTIRMKSSGNKAILAAPFYDP